MGLSSSMWTSVSGLLAHGEKMNVVGNNIANVSTVGFKAQRMDFEDFIYQTDFSASGPTQIGLGVGINAVMGDFSQGAFESTNSATDLAIGGNGFFEVRDQYSNEVYYTRAGNFNFDKDGVLRLPSGEILQGWEIDNSISPTLATGAAPITSTSQSTVQGTGVPKDITLESWNVPPRETTKVDFSINLTSDSGYDKTPSVTNPLFAMSTAWDGSQPPANPNDAPISADAYAYQTPIKVYDEAGNSHTLTTYFDQISNPTVENPGPPATEGPLIADLPNGYTMYEYMVTMDPAEDNRTFGGELVQNASGEYVLQGATSFQDTENAGVLMKGVMIFNASGELVNQTAYTYMGNTDYNVDPVTGALAPLPGNIGGATATVADVGHPDNNGSWQPTAVSNNGLPVFTANFTGHALANSVRQDAGTIDIDDSSQHLIELDFGLKVIGNLDDPWGVGAPVDPAVGGSQSIADVINVDPATAGFPGTIDYDDLTKFSNNLTEKSGDATRMTSGSSNTLSSLQDGYTFGTLSTVNIDQDGILYGIYTNGVTMPLYQITMYDFVNTQGLNREGGNLYSATRDSGNPQISVANQNGMGEIVAYNLEMSNVDMAREFVQMISTQRGFQANSKGITTVDEMLNTVIGMKR